MLSRSRQIGMSEYYIPMTEYAAYLDIVQLTNQEDRSFLVSVLTQVDVVLLHERLQAQEQQQQAAWKRFQAAFLCFMPIQFTLKSGYIV